LVFFKKLPNIRCIHFEGVLIEETHKDIANCYSLRPGKIMQRSRPHGAVRNLSTADCYLLEIMHWF
jgi:hypothetical protein